VVQFARPGGTNLFSCPRAKCLVIQTSASSSQNSADCKRTGQDVSQSCLITQGNTKSTNSANIEQSIVESGGCLQTASQAATINQENEKGANHARIHQKVTQSSKSSGNCGTQDQEAHQGATVDQTTTTGDNLSDIDQSQKQTETTSGGTSTTQDQNSGLQTDQTCDQPNEASDQAKNQCANVTQNSNDLPLLPVGGAQDSTLTQGITESATASNAGNLTQVQGLPTGGQIGTKDQHSTGVSTSHADQTVSQQETATGSFVPILRTMETGDPRCCQIQESNPNDQAFITQNTHQSSSPPTAEQGASLVGDCDTTGLCNLSQSATTDYASDTNTDSGMVLHETIVCEGSDGEGFCGPPD
jgi:hypothetical protein